MWTFYTRCKYTLRCPALCVIVGKKLCRAPGENSEINIISMKKLLYRHCKATVFLGRSVFVTHLCQPGCVSWRCHWRCSMLHLLGSKCGFCFHAGSHVLAKCQCFSSLSEECLLLYRRNETFFKICHSFSQRSWFLKGIVRLFCA